jgi:uncharacterized protein YjbI with pentapeptide repeats
MERGRRFWWIVGTLIICGIGLFIVGAYHFDWSGTGFLSKTLWDWLQLVSALLIPIAIAVFSWRYTRQQSRTENAIASDNQREAALQTYLDRISELLLDKNLRKSKPEDEVRHLARARTLTILPQLDAVRKGSLIRFLYESGLIVAEKRDSIIDLSQTDLNQVDLRKGDSIIDLSQADLNQVDLRGAKLSGANIAHGSLKSSNLSIAVLDGINLSFAQLNQADLSYSILVLSDLSWAYLQGARLIDTELANADLSYANLTEADLRGARLGRANLSGAKLKGAKLKGAFLVLTNLSGVDLREVDLNDVDLQHAILDNARMTKEQLSKIKPSKNTRS